MYRQEMNVDSNIESTRGTHKVKRIEVIDGKKYLVFDVNTSEKIYWKKLDKRVRIWYNSYSKWEIPLKDSLRRLGLSRNLNPIEGQ